MKKITLLFVALISIMSVSFAQAKKTAPKQNVAVAAPVWSEMKAFHAIMSATFHPTEEGNFTILRERASDLYSASKEWYASEIPAQFKAKETKETLEKLMIKCNEVMGAVANKENDETLKKLITEAHDLFHHISGECKKNEK